MEIPYLTHKALSASPDCGELVNVEEEPGEVADEKDDDEPHEDGRKVVLLLPPGLVRHLGRRRRLGRGRKLHLQKRSGSGTIEFRIGISDEIPIPQQSIRQAL